MAKKTDTRSRYIRENLRSVDYMGYRVTESGVVYNAHDKLIKPKFLFKGKKIDYVYIDITFQGKKRRLSYHKFVYMAWNQDFVDSDDYVITTIGRRFDYRVANLKCITRKEHLENLQKDLYYSDDEKRMIVEAYLEIKDSITLTEFSKKVNITPKTLSKYIKEHQNGI